MLKAKLLVTSTILTAYEIIKSMVVKNIKFIFLVGCGYGGYKYSPEYQTDVLARHKSPLIASAKYLAERFEAITTNDVDEILTLRDLRNSIAHELPSVLVTYELSALTEAVHLAREIVFKLDNFWLYIDIGHDPNHQGTDWDSAYSNSTIFMDHLLDLAESITIAKG